VDFVAKAVDKARAKASANKLDITFAQADATRLSSEASERVSISSSTTAACTV